MRPDYGRSGNELALFSTEGDLRYAGAWITLERAAGPAWTIAAHFGSGEGPDPSSLRDVRTDEGVLFNRTWYHVAVTFHASDDIRIFVNGARVEANEYGGDATALGVGSPRACPVLAHRVNPDGELGYEGTIDELYLFSRALADAEVEGLSRL